MGLGLDSQPDQPAVGSPGGSASKTLHAALLATARALQAEKLYGASHGLASKAAGEAADAWLDSSVELPLLLGVAPKHLIALGDPIDLGAGVAAIAALLHARDIAALHVVRKPAYEDVASLIAWLRRLEDRTSEPTEAPDCVRVVSVGEHTLGFRTETGAGRAAWAAVLESIVVSAAGPSGDHDAVLASSIQRISQELLTCSPEQRAHAELLLADMAGQASSTDTASPSDAGATDATGTLEAPTNIAVGEVLAHLSADARKSLLKIGCLQRAGWVDSRAHQLPLADLAAAMVEIDAAGRRPPDATVQLLTKLVGLTAAAPDVRSSLAPIAAKWSAKQEAHAPAGTITELLTNRQVEDYCPDDYRATLDASAGGSADAVRITLDLEDLNDERTGARCGRIAGWLLCDTPQTNIDQAGPMIWVADHLKAFIESQAWDTIWRVIDASLADAPSDAQRAAAVRVRESVAVRSMTERLLAASHTPSDGEGLSRLVRVAPEPTLLCLFSRVREGKQSPSHAHVRRAVSSAPSACVVRLLVQDLLQPSGTTSLWGVLDHLPEDRLVAAAGELLRAEHPEDVRLQCVRAIDARLAVWPREVMHAVLHDASSRVQQYALARAARKPDVADVSALAAALYGEATSRPPGPEATGVLVRALALSGPPGIAGLIDVLERGSKGVHRDRIRVCRRIAVELESHREVPAVAKALKAWRRSIGHTVGLFIVEDGRSHAA